MENHHLGRQPLSELPQTISNVMQSSLRGPGGSATHVGVGGCVPHQVAAGLRAQQSLWKS